MAGVADDGALGWRPSRSQVHRRKKYQRIFQAGLKTFEAARSQQSASYQSLCSWPSTFRPPPGLTRQVQNIVEDHSGIDHSDIGDDVSDGVAHGAAGDQFGTDHNGIDHGGLEHVDPPDHDSAADAQGGTEHSGIDHDIGVD